MKTKNLLVSYRLIKRYKEDLKMLKNEEEKKMIQIMLNNRIKEYKAKGGKRNASI